MVETIATKSPDRSRLWTQPLPALGAKGPESGHRATGKEGAQTFLKYFFLTEPKMWSQLCAPGCTGHAPLPHSDSPVRTKPEKPL